jgi:hypothetical protein
VDPKAVFARIEADMRAIWGDMAPAMLRKRLRDVSANPRGLTPEDVMKIIELLRLRTLPSILGEDGAEAKASLWRSWISDGSEETTVIGVVLA